MRLLRYLLWSIVALPALPLMILQARNIRKRVPVLPPAEGPEGEVVVQGSQPFRLLAVGESTIAGLGVATHEEGFTGTLAKLLAQDLNRSISWRVVARAGYTAQIVTGRLVPKLAGESPDLIIVGLGGNDAFTLNRPWRWQRQIRELIHSIRQSFPEVPIVFTNMPPIKEFPAFTPLIRFVVGNLVDMLGDWLDYEVQQHDNVWYSAERIRLNIWQERYNKSGSRDDFFSDGVHPAPVTYQVWADDLCKLLKKEVLN